MKLSRATALLILWLAAWASVALAQQRPAENAWIIESLRGEQGEWVYDFNTKIAIATDGVLVQYGGAVLTAEQASINEATGEVIADGHVRIQQGDQLWASEHIRYNFYTHQMVAEQFRTGQTPIFAAGGELHGDWTNKVYVARNTMVTSDDVSKPAFKIRARRIKIIPGRRIEATHAVLYVGEVPVFYFPWYSRNLGENANNWNVMPGYRSLFGPYILGTYNWHLNQQLDGNLHLDYRERRGPGVGPDLNYHLGRWGDGTLSYYYTHDQEPEIDNLGVPISEDRQRLYFSYQANPATNLYVKSLVRYESDLAVVRDFFEGEYRRDPQPNSFFDVNKFWQNFSVDAQVQPQVNNFLETVERLPDIRITGYRQEIGATPLYYESESSAGYYRRAFAENAGFYGPLPGLDYEAGRADTFHQVLLPETLFGWLNVTPRAGGRFTYYSEASGPGAITEEQYREVFNTGAEVSFKASRLWRGAESDLLEINGLRHIVEPSANYVFVPSPSVRPPDLPQFDYELPSLPLLPITFPEYNAIDSIDSQNVIRWGLRNRLQTKRKGQISDVVNWDIFTDWRLKPNAEQTTFSDVYSDLVLRPRSWLSLESITRYDTENGEWRMSYTTITLSPNEVWSWRIGHYYLRNDPRPSPLAIHGGNDIFTSAFLYRLNENWGFGMHHYYDLRLSRMQEQAYTVYRDLRSWTAALTFLIRDNPFGPEDYTVAFTFSLKAFPRFRLGSEAAGPYSLLGP